MKKIVILSCPILEIDVPEFLKLRNFDFFHPDFFSRQVEVFLSRFFLAESRLPALARKSMKKTNFPLKSNNIGPRFKSSLSVAAHYL